MNRPLLIVLSVAMLALAACGAPAAPAPSPTAPPPTQPPAVAPVATPTPTLQAATPAPAPEEKAYPAPEAPADADAQPYPQPEAQQTLPDRWVFDGVISADEYDHQIAIGPVAVFWANDDTYLYVAAEAQTQGWLGIGIDPDNRMQGADYIIAAFDGEARIWDAWGQAPVGATHPPDTELGGTMDIVAWAAVRDGPFFRFEALRPLVTGDPYDKPLERGRTYDIIVAVGTSPAFNAPHAYRGWGQITLD